MHDWETILRRGFESKELDYKRACAWSESDKKACCELVKDILAIANTKGGFIVVGVEETPTGFNWNGLSEQQCKSFETSRLNQFVQNYADPPINTHVIKHVSQASTFVIIEIPRFPDTPHVCQKDFPSVLAAGSLYVRTDNNESAPVKNSSDMRAIIEHSVRNRADQLLVSFRAILTSSAQPAASPADAEQFSVQTQDAKTRCNASIPAAYHGRGFRETIIHPAEFVRQRFKLTELEQMAEAASVTYRGWPYIFYSQRRLDYVSYLDDGLEMLLIDEHHFQFWRLHQSGLLYVNEMFQEDSGRESTGQGVLARITTAYTCAEAVQCLVDLFTARISDQEAVRFHMRLLGMRGRILADLFANKYIATHFRCDADQIVYEQQQSVAEWRAGTIPHAIEIYNHVLKKFQAPPSPAVELAQSMQQLLTRQL
jgi:hypothetical protein